MVGDPYFSISKIYYLNIFRYDNENECFNDDYNPFAHISQEYVEKKEKQLERGKQKPRLTVRQQQIKKDIELWENNRLFRSGMLTHTFSKNCEI